MYIQNNKNSNNATLQITCHVKWSNGQSQYMNINEINDQFNGIDS